MLAPVVHQSCTIESLGSVPPPQPRDNSGAAQRQPLSPSRVPAVEATFRLRRSLVKARLTDTGLSFHPISSQPRVFSSFLPLLGNAVAFDDILSAQHLEHTPCLSVACLPCRERHHVVINTFRRSHRKQCLWHPTRLLLSTQSKDTARQWTEKINSALAMLSHRPHALLVILNPFGGARKARHVWHRHVRPILDTAGIQCTVMETQKPGHAKQVVEKLTLSQANSFDGIVAVGGDGLFQECMNGLLALRSLSPELAAAAKDMRLGHIPAGSTDAVAYSINGTRDEETAALHIALGDRTPIDIMRVDTADGASRFAACVASYGYMGDLLRQSEHWRWMGPFRYTLAGTMALLYGRAYQARVAYLPVEMDQPSRRSVCRSQCDLCTPATSPAEHAAHAEAFLRPSKPPFQTAGWRSAEGRFKSIMAVVMPCRSDKSVLGLSPYSHLADGRIVLVLVHDCSILDYLRFLASIPARGIQADRFTYVETIDCTAVSIQPIGVESAWNVDGELLKNNHVTAEAHQALISVFARGVE
ncbi:hypothetical protein WJX72_006250 [[Myrmecia] bisecta]|uniref:DAGKc domain-containing protein n=1 Tax=[Myrmecia] bisecta TaxID=41462 RepID=A0AAW1QQV1_9CHLO